MGTADARALFVLVLLLVPLALAVDLYTACPGVNIEPPFPQSTLTLNCANLSLDISGAVKTFSLTVDSKFGPDAINQKELPDVVLNGYIYFLSNQLMEFAFSNASVSSCNDNNGAPPLCPHLQEVLTGPWTFGYQLSSDGASTLSITIQNSVRAGDASSPSPVSFLGAKAPFPLVCSGSCSAISNQLPPAPMPENITVDVINVTSVLTPNDVLYYGAKCDGVTDDTAAITTAVNSGKGLLRFPRGTCKIVPPAGGGTTGISMPSNVFLQGQGTGLSVLKCAPGPAALFSACIRIAAGAQNVSFSGLTFKLDASTSAVGTTSFLFAFAAGGATSRILMEAIEIDGSITVTAANLTSHAAVGISLGGYGSISQLTLNQVEMHHVDYGFLQTNAANVSLQDIRVYDCWFHDNFDDDLSFNAPNSVSVLNVALTDNVIENNQAYRVGRTGIAIAYAGPGVGVLIDANVISGVFGLNAIHLEEGPYEFVVSNNIINIQGTGITVQWNNVSDSHLGHSPLHGLIIGNVVHLNGRDIFYNSQISDGINIVYDAVYLQGAQPGIELTVADNIVSGKFARGITAATNPWQSITLDGNKVDGPDTCFSTIGGSYLFTDNLSSNCSYGISSVFARVRRHSFYNVGTPIIVTGMWSAENLVFELPRGSCTAGGFATYNLLPANSSVAFSFAAQISSNIFGTSIGTGSTSKMYGQLLYDGTSLYTGPVMNMNGASQEPVMDVSSGNLRARLFCSTAKNNVSMEVTLTGYYVLSSFATNSGMSGTYTVPNLNARGYGWVGTVAPSSTSVGDWTATRLFQNNVQVLDTLTAGSGITIAGSGNSRTIARGPSTGTTPTISFSTGACTGGGTAPASLITGAPLDFMLTFNTGTGTCGGGGVGTAVVGTITLNYSFPTKAVCSLTNAAQNQGAGGGNVNAYITCGTRTCDLNTFTTATNSNNFVALTQYSWNVRCGGY